MGVVCSFGEHRCVFFVSCTLACLSQWPVLRQEIGVRWQGAKNSGFPAPRRGPTVGPPNTHIVTKLPRCKHTFGTAGRGRGASQRSAARRGVGRQLAARTVSRRRVPARSSRPLWARRLRKRDEFHVHDERSSWGDDWRVAARAVRHGCRDCQLCPLAAAHALHRHIEARYDLAEPDSKLKRHLPVPGGVNFQILPFNLRTATVARMSLRTTWHLPPRRLPPQ